MASILYQQIWESPLLQVANDFDNSGSSVSSWPAISNETWATAQDLKTMEDANSMAFGNYTDLECSKLDLYPLQIPQNEEPHACRPSDLSPARRPFYPSSLSTPVLSPASSSSPISITSPVPRNFSPEYFNLERTITPEAETIRAEIKRNPEPFIMSVFNGSNQSHLRDQLRGALQSQWWQESRKEPRACLNVFIRRIGNRIFECHSCGKRLSRADRAVDHFRTHIHHRPYHCTGAKACGDAGCQSAFFTRDCLKSHISKHEVTCDRCQTAVEDKNLNRHRETRKCRRFGLTS